MYATLLWLHSNFRWIVLLTAVLAIGDAWLGVITRRAWTPISRVLGLALVSAIDLQFVVGLTIYTLLSPITHAAFANMREAMHNAQLRFFTVEHAGSMLVVVALVHIGNVHARRAKTDVQRYRRFAIWTSVAAILMFLAIPWPWLDVGRPLGR